MRLKIINRILFLFFFALYLAVGYYIACVLQIYHSDAISRTALAFFTIFGRNPHLGAIGFVWQPLPSLLQIPLLLILRPLGLIMMAGPIVTAIAGALSVLVVYKIGLLINPSKKLLPLLISLLFGLNPLIILYSAIGTSEMIFITSLLISSYYLVKWFFQMKQLDLILCSIFVALSFWSRYESLPFFAGAIVLLLSFSLYKKLAYKEMESTSIQFVLPFVFSLSFWILINWVIMKNPFYFLNSIYSNASLTINLRANPQFLEYSYHSFINSFIYVLKRVFLLAPIIVALPFILLPLILRIKKKAEDLFLFLFLTFPYFAILLFHIYQLYSGQSFGWLRFYIYAIIMGTLTVIFVIKKQKYLIIISILLLLFGTFTTGYAMTRSDLGKEEFSFVQKILNPSANLALEEYLDQRSVSTLMNNTKGLILVDTDKGFSIPLFAKNPERYVITSDLDYVSIVKKYYKSVDWVIVKKPAPEDFTLNKIYYYYPKIWDGKAPHIHLYKQVYSWKIFRVDK